MVRLWLQEEVTQWTMLVVKFTNWMIALFLTALVKSHMNCEFLIFSWSLNICLNCEFNHFLMPILTCNVSFCSFIVNPLLLVMVIIYRSSQSMKGSGRIGQGILIISFMLLFVQSHGQFQFDYFKLALQWTPTTCAVSTCNQTKFSQFPQEFTIHGLWPSTYAYPQPNWCQPRLLYDTNNTQVYWFIFRITFPYIFVPNLI